MDSLPVTLIVKAPNQQIEDQKIRCETSWSINRLKQHLSEVYPSKPPHHEQKLIYSGQLLNDSVILKDVLRQYEGQDTHTVHLVCTPLHTRMNTRPRQTTADSRSPGNSNTNSPSSSSSASRRDATQPQHQEVPQNRVEPDNHRVPTNFPNARFPDNSFPWTNYNGQMPQMDTNALNQYQLQMAWMQQAYMQYMTQYMQFASGQTLATPTQNPHLIANAAPPNAQPNEPPQAAPQPNAVPQNLQENEERDWLDVFYMLSRAMVLFSVVYFYSSPIRFVFVLLLGIALYLYQAGFFRNININNNNMNGTPEGDPQEEQAPTRFTVAWTFITTFFASLIPEIPNINA
ncbi:unnamed protein product [Ceutorhynchus assimilis]|uniref:Ubiquitin-like domain-containing protein n=1 Tax=Ceutorhynchus assimilis TaxID=467358 RepID=A0A9N9QN83_9CUCU|nr:unnamed protein product [Ceutorhynchus assimilis]